MPHHPFRQRPLLAACAIALLLGLLAPAYAQQMGAGGRQQKEEVEDRRPKIRSRALKDGSFRGLSPEEAREAQERFDKGRSLEDAGRLGSALRAYKSVYKGYPRSTLAPEAYHRSALIYIRLDKYPRAFEALDVVLTAYPNYGHFNELVALQYRIAYESIKGHRGKMFGILPGFSNRDRGLVFFERLILNAPYSDYAPLALMNIAERHITSKRPEMAIDALDRLITNYPSSIVTADAYLRLAQVHEKLVDGPLYDQKSTHESLNSYQDFLILFPKDPDVAKAEGGQERMKEMLARSRLKIADFYYYKRARYQAARVFYNEAITAAPNSDSARLARERLAQVDVDEARRTAEIAAAAERPDKKRRFFGLFEGDSEAPDEAPGTGGEASDTSVTTKPEGDSTTVAPASEGK